MNSYEFHMVRDSVDMTATGDRLNTACSAPEAWPLSQLPLSGSANFGGQG